MAVMNDLDRFHLAGDVIDRVPQLGAKAAYVKQAIRDKLIEHKQYISRPRRGHARGPRVGLDARRRAVTLHHANPKRQRGRRPCSRFALV